MQKKLQNKCALTFLLCHGYKKNTKKRQICYVNIKITQIFVVFIYGRNNKIVSCSFCDYLF